MDRLYLLHKNVKVAEMEVTDNAFIRIVTIYNRNHMPIGTNQTITSIIEWLGSRNLSDKRPGVKKLLERCELVSTAYFPLRSANVSLTDCYWFASREDLENGLSWEDVDPMVYGTWSGAGKSFFLGNVEEISEIDSPDFALNGRRRKVWIREQDGVYLAKEDLQNGLDTFAEVAAAKVAGALGIPHAWVYWGLSDASSFLTMTRCLTENGTAEIVPFSQLRREGFTPENFERFAEEHGLMADLQNLYLLDYLIGNPARDDENLAVLRNPDSLALLGLCPPYGHAEAFRLKRLQDPEVRSSFTGNTLREDMERTRRRSGISLPITSLVDQLEILRDEMGLEKEMVSPVIEAFKERAERVKN